MLSINDVQGKLYLQTKLMPSVTIHENNAAAALEIMSRFAADPHWLIYLPPTMSPCETSPLPEYLEHPLEAFAYYRNRGVQNVVCEKKHMGSRAVIVLCHTPEAAKKRFGVSDGSVGIIYTRTGRHFFDNPGIEQEVLDEYNASRPTEDDTAPELIIDFYRRFIYRMEYMLTVGKEKGYDLISFMGP